MKYFIFYLTLSFVAYACSLKDDKGRNPRSLTIVEAKEYTVPKDSVAPPKVIPVDTHSLRKVRAGVPRTIPTNTNIRVAGRPYVVSAGTPRNCTPGTDTFALPFTVVAIDSPFAAGIPEVVEVKNAQTRDQNPQNFSNFGKLQGLKHNSVNCMLEDQNGNLWFGTYGGAAKYDGQFFTHFTTREGLGTDFILTMLEDHLGNIWFGTEGKGVTRYDGKTFTHFTRDEGLAHDVVRSILQDTHGNLWFGTVGGGVSRYDGTSFTQYTKTQGLGSNEILCMLEDRKGNIWFGTNGDGATRFDGASFVHYTMKEGLGHNVVRKILEDRSGNLWFGTQGGGITRFDGQAFAQFTENEGLNNNVVLSMLEDRSGDLLFGTYGGGISRYDGESFTHLSEKEGLVRNVVLSMLEDKRGRLWLGTPEGVARHDGKVFTHYTQNNGLTDRYVLNILEDTSGLWFATINGVSLYDGNSFSHFTEKEGLIYKVVGCMLKDRKGNLWFGTHDGGACMYDGTFFTHFTTEDGLCGNYILSLLEDRKGNIWFGTYDGGVSRYDGTTFTNFAEAEGLIHQSVNHIAEDKHGNLWFGTDNGVTRFDGTTFTHLTSQGGLSNNFVMCIREDKHGMLWFGTAGGGACRYDGTSFTYFSEADGLNKNVTSILEDKDGNLWFGTSFGLNKTTHDILDEVMRKNSVGTLSEHDVIFKNYTYEDGFLGIGCLGNSLFQDSHGTLWIGTNDRLTAFHRSDDINPDTIPPNIFVTDIELFHERIPWQSLEQQKDSIHTLANGVTLHDLRFDGVTKWNGLPENLRLRHDQNHLTFNFIGITQRQTSKVKYQFILEGNDRHWSNLTSRTQAPYGNLSHGSYTFKVKAMNSEGYWSKEFHYPFAIRPPWWLSWWAYCLYVLSGIALIWIIYRYQKQRIVRREREKIQQREIEQAREIEKAYKQLEIAHEDLKTMQGQLVQSEKMASLGELTAGIAHEIQNPLNFVNNFSEVNAELIKEMEQEIEKGNLHAIKTLSSNIRDNEEKIQFHGKRADAIVKSMLQHSRSGSGKKELIDLNALVYEYLRLSYHGLRAKDKTFNAEFHADLDKDLPKIEMIPQEIGRVVLNLMNNAFYAVSEKKKNQPEGYIPTVTVITRKTKDSIILCVRDNGPGVPEKLVDKIFEPFFTTKPTGQGTGLGLSLSYDIITKGHGGQLRVNTSEGEFSEFIISLPLKTPKNSI